MRRFVAGAVALTVGIVGTLAATVAPAAGASRAPLPWTRPAWAADATPAGTTPATEAVSVRVLLKWRDRAGAEALALAVSDPTDPRYQRHLSPAEVRARFGPTRESEMRVTAWLRSAGLAVGAVPANAMWVPATGTTDQIARAFGTGLAQYRYRGRTVHAATSTPTVPVAVAADVAAVTGLDSAVTMRRPGAIRGRDHASLGPAAVRSTVTSGTGVTAAPPSPGFRNAAPCSRYWAEQVDTTDPAWTGVPAPLPYVPCGLVPGQVRSAYGIDRAVDRGNDGRGVRVAVVGAYASPTALADLTLATRWVDPTHVMSPAQYRELVLPETAPALEDVCAITDWYAEQTLDLQAVHSTAPGASILYVGAPSCLDQDLDAALNTVVAGHLADIVSNSWGNNGEDASATDVAIFDGISIQAALEGIGLYVSSGDDGDESLDLGRPSPDFPASSPWVTAVGGTSLAVDTRGTAVWERGWETGIADRTTDGWSAPYPGDFLYGSGGGTSGLYPEPAYQSFVVPPALAARPGGGAGRVVPDISMVGDPNTGLLVGQTQTFADGVHFDFARIGGTSLSSPLFAGVMALAQQRSRRSLGFANPALYRVAGRGGIRDVVPGGPLAVARVDYVNGENDSDGLATSARSVDFAGLTIHTAVGYDRVTGMGTPWVPALIARLARR